MFVAIFCWFEVRTSAQNRVGWLETDCQRSSCQPGSNKIRGFILDTYTDLKSYNCFCDDLCSTYGDCCKDYVRPLNATLPIHRLQPQVVTCDGSSSVWDNWSEIYFYLVDRCPWNYNNRHIRQECESRLDLFHRLPVDGKLSKVLYQNVYCAMCNGETDVLFWKVQIECFDRNHETNLSTAYVNNTKCNTKFAQLEDSRIRPCKPVVSECPESWNDGVVADECSAELNTEYVYWNYGMFENTAYRNRQCAKCNGVNEAMLSCLDLRMERERTPIYGYPRMPQYSFLFDITSGSGSLYDERYIDERYIDEESPIRFVECDFGSTYDPFAQMCRPIFCNSGFQLTDTGL